MLDWFKDLLLRGYFRTAIPNYDGRFSTPKGISPKSEILRDTNGVPSCFAPDPRSLFFLQGVCQGQDRLWQIHTLRMVAAGRLSEIARERTVANDTLARQIGFRRIADEDWKGIKARAAKGDQTAVDAVVMLEGFAQGVNWAAANARQLPPEFTFTGQKPWAPWSPEDSLSVVRLLSFVLCFGAAHQLLRQGLYDLFGAEAAKEWTSTALDELDFPPTAPGDGQVSEELRKATANILKAAMSVGTKSKGEGSNWWVVSGKHTKSGLPILASDPHLTVKVPHFWYEINLHMRAKGGEKDSKASSGGSTGSFIGAGVCAAGVPGLFIGHNSFCAWGITLGYGDVEDLFVTRLRKKQNGSNDWQYQYDGKWRDATVTREVLKVKGSEDREVEIISTHRGVVLSSSGLQLYEPVANKICEQESTEVNSSEVRVVLEYSGIQRRQAGTHAMESLQQLLRARSFAEFDSACSHLSTNISLNFGYADTNGHIGYVYTGEGPVRPTPRASELLPIRGWSSEHDYKGYLDHKQLPKALDPEQGFLVSANHCIVDYKKGYPHYLGQVFKSGWRAAQIEANLLKLIDGANKVTPAQMIRLQNNTCSIPACEFVELVSMLKSSELKELDGKPLSESQRSAIKWGMEQLDGLLKSGCDMTADSVGAAVYQLVHSRFVIRLLTSGFEKKKEELKADSKGFTDDLLISVVGGGSFDAAKVVKILNEFQGNLHLNVLRILRRGDKSWWLKASGGLNQTFFASLLEAVDYVRGDGSDEPKKWGEIHVMRFRHPISTALGFAEGKGFDVPSLPGHGDTNTIRQVKSASLTDLSATASNVSLRFIADMSDLRNGCSIITPLGNCGVLGSPYYAIDNEKWHSGEVRKMVWEESDVRAIAVNTMRFNGDERMREGGFSCSMM